jgi:hypothetical protein
LVADAERNEHEFAPGRQFPAHRLHLVIGNGDRQDVAPDGNAGDFAAKRTQLALRSFNADDDPVGQAGQGKGNGPLAKGYRPVLGPGGFEVNENLVAGKGYFVPLGFEAVHQTAEPEWYAVVVVRVGYVLRNDPIRLYLIHQPGDRAGGLPVPRIYDRQDLKPRLRAGKLLDFRLAGANHVDAVPVAGQLSSQVVGVIPDAIDHGGKIIGNKQKLHHMGVPAGHQREAYTSKPCCLK